GIHAKIRELHDKILPKGMQIETFYDRSDLVGLTLRTVHENLLTGFLLVVGVVWLFLRSAVGSAVVSIVIPLSLLVAFLVLYALGLPQPDLHGSHRFRHPRGWRRRAGGE